VADVLDNVDFTRDDICSGRVPGIASVRDTDQVVKNESGLLEVRRTEVELSTDVDAKSFACLLQFLYTGRPNISG
jgi:hypothetical protein